MRVCAFLLLLSSISVPAFPQCTLTPISSAPFRASVLDVSVDGNDLWAATGYGVQLFDRAADPPVLLSTIAIPGTTRIVRARNGIVYVGSGSSIYVVRRGGKGIEIVRSVDAGGTVNDIVITTYLFVATSNGIAHFELVDATNPVRTNATLATSGANVFSLAEASGTLYAADGDSTVEVFSISSPALPQKTGALTSLPRTNSVHVAGTRVYTSDGLNTEVFIGGTKASTLAIGSTSLASIGGDELFVAGSDRRVQAIDFTLAAQPVELFEAEIAPSSGTINRISAMQHASSRLYLAAGDIGLLSYDTSRFTKPYPVHGYALGATTTAIASGNSAFVAKSAGGIQETSISASGALSAARAFSGSTLAHDVTNNFIVTSSSNLLSYTTLFSTSPTTLWTSVLAKPITAAVLISNKAYALLSDGTIWSLDVAEASPAAKPVNLGGAKIALMERSGSSVALAEVRDDKTTLVRYYANGDLTGTPQSASVPGSATALAVSGNGVAVFTFRGINLISFPSGSVTVLPESNTAIARALAFDGTTLLELTESALTLWSTSTLQRIRDIGLSAEGIDLAIGGQSIAVIATTEGVTSIAYGAASRQPVLVPRVNGNRYYRKLAASSTRIYLFDNGGVEIYSTLLGNAPHYVNAVRAQGLIDIAASDTGLFTLASNGMVSSYSPDGYLVAQTTISDGADSQPLAIAAADRGVWVSISKGCLTGSGCEKKTFILDAATLATAMTLPGGVVDLTTQSNRAYAIFDLPAEIRVYDLTSDPLRPALTAMRASEGSPKSIAAAAGTVYVLGDILRPYNDSLTPLATIDPGGQADASEKVRIDGACAVVTGRTFDPLVTAVPSWSAGPALRIPSAVIGSSRDDAKSIATQPGRFVILTDTSIEIWGAGAVVVPRRHVAR